MPFNYRTILLPVVIVIVLGISLTAFTWQAHEARAQQRENITVALRDEDDERRGEEYSEDEERELERHHRHLEIERAELETGMGRLEMVERVAELAENKVAAAAFALMHVEEFFGEDEEGGIKFLQSMLKEADDQAVRRIIRVKLAEIYAGADQRKKAEQQIRALILGK